MFCEELFTGIEKLRANGNIYEVTYSMLEIYSETVRDLLDPQSTNKKGGLKVREHPKLGFYGKAPRRSKLFSGPS